MVKQAHSTLINTINKTNMELPRNTGGKDLVNRKLDCAVIRTLHEYRTDNNYSAFDTVRAPFFEGGALYQGAGFGAKNHIQICVRDNRNIIGYFRPLNEQGKPMKFV